MIRRGLLTGSALCLTSLLGGCLTTEEPGTDDGRDRHPERRDGTPNSESTCIDEIGVILVVVEEKIDWNETDVPVVESDDERIGSISILQDLLSAAVEAEEYATYEYRGEQFESYTFYGKRDEIPESEELITIVSQLPSGDVAAVPPGPYVRHEGTHFSLDVETSENCPE